MPDSGRSESIRHGEGRIRVLGAAGGAGVLWPLREKPRRACSTKLVSHPRVVRWSVAWHRAVQPQPQRGTPQ
eukprot:7389728-Prymnesium_polylepis.1